MRIAVLGSVQSWYVKDLQRASQGRGWEIVAVPFRRLRGWLGPTQERIDTAAAAEPDLSSSIELTDVDRVLVRTMPPGSLEQVVFRMDALHRLESAGVPVLNPPRAIETAVDKYLATARLQSADLPVPPTAACETAESAMEAFNQLGGDVVVKPIFGSEGRGIFRLSDPELALRAFRTLERLGAVIYQQAFIPHEGADLRALVLGTSVLAAMRRRHRTDWRTNVSRGAQAERVVLSDSQEQLALRAAEAVGAPLAGVDLLPARDGTLYCIEVNAVPGWRALAAVSDTDIAACILEFLVGQTGR